MKRLLIITELFHPSVGGQEVRYLELGQVFVQNGWRVDVATIRIDDSPFEENIQGMFVRRLVSADHYKRSSVTIRRDARAIVRFSFAVRKYLRQTRYDAVLFSLWPLLPQVIANPPPDTVAVIDWCEHRSGGLWRVINSLQSRSTNKHISVSEGLRNVLETQYGVRDVECIPSGIFTSKYCIAAEKAGVLFFGRLSAHKRPEEAIQAMILAHKFGCSEHLTLAGEGPQLHELKSRYGHLPYIRILGRVSDEEKIRLFATHRIYVLPSIREGFPRAIAESMASGTPSITSNHPDNGTVDIVRQYNAGIVTEPGAESLARAIVRLVSNKAEWQIYQQSGLRNSTELDWQRVYEKLLKHLGFGSQN